MISPVDPQVVGIEEFLGQIRSHRRRGITLAAQLMNGVEQLKHTGRFLPDELLREHQGWRDTWVQLRKRACHEKAFQEYLPEGAETADMCQWERALKQGLESFHRRKDESQRARLQALECLKNVLNLTSTTDPRPLAMLHAQAQELKTQLEQGATLSPGKLHIYQIFWELVLDARDGRVDEPASLQRAMQINQAFDLLLTLQVVRGQIGPNSGWSRSAPSEATEMVKAEAKATAAAIEPRSKAEAAVTQRDGEPQPLSRRAAMVSAVHSQQGPLPVPKLNVATIDADNRRERRVLEAVRDEARNQATLPTSDVSGETESGAALMACQDCVADAADYVLEALRELPTGQAVWKTHVQLGLQFLARGIGFLRAVSTERTTAADDQEQTLRWLQKLSGESEQAMRRYLNPVAEVELTHLKQLKQEMSEQLNGLRQPRRVNKILDRIQRRLTAGTVSPEQDLERWQQIVADVDELIQDENVAPSHPELREILAGSIDRIPVGLLESRSMRKVLAAIDRYLADSESDEALKRQPKLSQVVQQAARLLRGKKMVLIGGVPRQRTRDWMRESLGLRELVWETAGEHEATLKLQPQVQAPDVSIVLILVRSVGYGHADDIRTYCQQVRKPYVSVARGYRLEQLAQEILDQRGDELRESSKS